MRLEPNVKTQTSLKTRLIKYGGGGIAILSILGIALWLYFQVGDQEQSMAQTGSNAPANDTKVAAEWLTDLYEDQSNDAEFTTENATADAESGSCFNNGTQNGVWFKFQALYSDATITVKTGGNLGTATNLEVALLDNSNNEIACGTASGSGNVTLNPTGLTQDDWYYVLVDHASSSDVGTFTVYIDNVSPTKYYTRDKGDWDDNNTWSTSGYNGSSAGSQPTKSNVVFVQDLNGDLKIDGITAECAGIVMTSSNKKSEIKIESNGTLNAYGKFHMDGSGSREMDLKVDEATLYVQDEFLIQKSNGYKEFKVEFKKSDVAIERSFTVDHSNGKGGKVEIDENNSFNVGEDFLVYNQGGYNGLEFEVKKSDIIVGGKARFEYTNGSGDVKFEFKEDMNFTIADNFEIYRNGGSNKFEVEMKDNVTLDIGNDFSFLYDNGSADVDFKFIEDSDMIVGGDFTMEKNGGGNKFDVEFKKNVNLTIGGDANFRLTNGSSEFKVKMEEGIVMDVAGNMLWRETGGSNPLKFEFGKNNESDTLKVAGNFQFGADNGSNGWYKVDIVADGDAFWDIGGHVEMVTAKGKLDFHDNSGILRLSGSQPQNLTGESSDQKSVNYQNIIVDNSYTASPDSAASVILQGPIELEERLELIDGIVRTSSSAVLTLERNINLIGGSDTSFVDGPLRKVGFSDFEFPVGDQGVYAPMEIYNQSDNSSNNELEVHYINEMYNDTSTDNSLSHVSSIEYWDVTKVNGTGNLSAHMRLSWSDGNGSGISDLSDLTISQYTGSEWTSMEPTATSGTPTNGSINTTYGVGSFGQFTFGSLGGGNVLPIKLKSFDVALQSDNTVLLSWETSQEVNNDFFTLERSTDGKTFEEIGQVKGAGNSDITQQYSFLDESPANGVNYYRLKQTDFDGKFEYFPVKQVTLASEMEKTASLEITDIFPVPFTSQLTIEVNSATTVDVNIALVSMSGSQFTVGNQSLSQGRNTISAGNLNQLPKGTYILTITTPEQVVTRKVIKANN